MERRERVLILSAGVGAGHNSAAAAVETACRARDDVEDVKVLDVLDVSTSLYRDTLSKGYFVLASGLPWLVEWGYDVSDPPFRRRGAVAPWDRVNSFPAVREIRRYQPTSIICSHFIPAGLVASLLLRGSVTAKTGIVTTDYDFQGLWLTSAFHSFAVARGEGRAQLTALGLPEDRVVATGIPIAAGAPPRTEPDEPPTILISAGAAGGDYTVGVVRQVLRMQQPFRAVVVCGRNDELRDRIERITAHRRDRFQVLGFTTEMPSLLQAASLFIGKPGGLSSSECMAAGLPMVLVNPIPGQEVRNGDYLIEEGAAIRCNTLSALSWKLDALLADPGRLTRMADRAAALGRPDAAADVVRTVLDGPERPLVITRAAQKTILAASEQHVGAADLTGPTSLVRLVDEQTGVSVAVLRAREFDELRTRAGGGDGPIRLVRTEVEQELSRTRWEARRVARCILGASDEVTLVRAG